MKSSLVLTEGEELQATLTGELFATSTNLLINAIMKIMQGILAIFGVRMAAVLVVTNKRVVLEQKTFTCWVIPQKAAFKSIPFAGVASVEYGYDAMCSFGLCRKYALTVTQNSGESFGFVLKGGEEVARTTTNAIIQNIK